VGFFDEGNPKRNLFLKIQFSGAEIPKEV